LDFFVAEAWKKECRGAAVGVLAIHDVANPERHPALERRKKKLEEQLRSRFSGCDRSAIKALPVLQAYDAYYKRFKKTYHIQLQLESVALKGKPIPRVASLVEAMFMAELQDLLLTAGHDLEAVETPVGIHVADGTERYVRLNGRPQQLKAGDMMIADARGVISSVIYGPDRRTRIRQGTTQVLFTAYAPPGVGFADVRQHLQSIRDNVLLIAPGARVGLLDVYRAE
jgi:DNA/RNA-binding domain of Phe-tRNA-synthetase-like protein